MAIADLFVEKGWQIEGWLTRKLSGDRETARDIAADAWLRCLLAERRGQDVQLSYIWMAARNRMTDYWRQNGRIVSLDLLCETSNWEPSPVPDASLVVEVYDEADKVLARLNAREVATICKQAEGYRESDIAAVLGCSRAAVKKMRSRARGKARSWRAKART